MPSLTLARRTQIERSLIFAAHCGQAARDLADVVRELLAVIDAQAVELARARKQHDAVVRDALEGP